MDRLVERELLFRHPGAAVLQKIFSPLADQFFGTLPASRFLTLYETDFSGIEYMGFLRMGILTADGRTIEAIDKQVIAFRNKLKLEIMAAIFRAIFSDKTVEGHGRGSIN
jgi:hypothetical protein